MNTQNQTKSKIPAELLITIDKLNKFGFHKISRIAFIVLSIIIPVILTGISTIFINKDFYNSFQLASLVITLITTSLSFICLVTLQGNIIMKTPYTFFAIFSLGMNVLLPLISILLSFFITSSSTINDILLYLQVLLEIFIIVFGIYLCDFSRKNYILLFKGLKNKKTLGNFLFIIGFGFVMAFALNRLFSLIPSATFISHFNESNANQDSINKLLDGPLYLSIPTILLTTLVAPIAEELATREGIFGIFGENNKKVNWSIAAICSLLYFSNMHVQTSNIIVIFQYWGTGIALIAAFILGKRNALYSIPIHMSWNILVLIEFFLTK